MKRICLGTMITLLYQSRMRGTDRVKTVCDGIFAAFNCKCSYNKELPSHLKSGHDPTPGFLVDAARNLSIEDIDMGFEKHVIPLIHNEKREALIRAIKDILRDDTTISGGTIVGMMPGFEKDSILNNNTFDESALLANVVTYAITSTINDNLRANIKEIGNGYVDGFLGSGEKIYFDNPRVDQDKVSPLKRTMKDPRFNQIFKKATEMRISGMENPSKACVFYIDPNNCKFRFRELEDLIINNIGSYVFSRVQITQITNTTKNKAAVGSRAMLKFVQKYGANAGTVLGEILLFIFMEQELGAPKIMSKIELDEYHGGIVSKSDGIHLLSLDQFGQSFHQLVFGASDMEGDLSLAVDRAFEKIIKIEKHRDAELLMVESTTQHTIYDSDTTQYMVKLMRPQKGGTNKPDMAFGAFLGYTIKLDNPETDSQKYRNAVKDQLIKDIDGVQSRITELIVQNGLSGYSFYFYVLPFNDAPNEKVSIIEELLTGGVI